MKNFGRLVSVSEKSKFQKFISFFNDSSTMQQNTKQY